MMKLKKATSLFAAALLSTALLTGCGNDADEPVENEEPAVDASEEEEVETNEEADATSMASISDDSEALVHFMSEDGGWFFSLLDDMDLEGEELRIDGEFHHRENPEGAIRRKLGLYARNEAREIAYHFTITTPEVIVTSPNAEIQHGTIDGNITVEGTGFVLTGTTVTGDVVFTSQEAFDSADLTNANVEGTVTVEGEEVDVTSAASLSRNVDHLVYMLSAEGSWFFAPLSNMELTEDLVIAGEFHHRNNEESPIRRKLGIYATANREMVAEFTLTVPNIIVQSPNTEILNGTVDGNIHVEAEGFVLSSTVTGDVTFASQELYDAADLSEATIEGEVSVVE